MNTLINKRPYNEEFHTCNFSSVLDTADTITTATAVITDKTGADLSTTMISDVSIVLSSKGVRYKLKGGTFGDVLNLKIRVDTSSSQKFEEPFTVYIK